MKLLHVINSLNTGGAEKLIRDTLPLYAEKGIAVDLLLLMKTDGPFLSELKKEKCCKIIELSCQNVYNPLMIFKIRKIIRNYDIVHVHLFPALYWVAKANFLNRKKTTLLFTEHSTHNKRRNFFFTRLIDKLIYKQYSHLVCITEKVKKLLQKHLNANEEKFTVIQNGVNYKKINESQAYKKVVFFDGDANLLIQVSSFSRAKDHLTLVKALHDLPDNYKLLLAGDGPDKKEIQDYVTQHHLDSRVQFLGIRQDIPALLKTADIIILSSHYEGLSIAALEAMSSGRPFIASDVPGLHELTKGAGILFPHGDAKQLAEEIQALMANPEYYREIGEKCQTRAKEYDINRMVQKHIALYKKMLSKDVTPVIPTETK